MLDIGDWILGIGERIAQAKAVKGAKGGGGGFDLGMRNSPRGCGTWILRGTQYGLTAEAEMELTNDSSDSKLCS